MRVAGAAILAMLTMASCSPSTTSDTSAALIAEARAPISDETAEEIDGLPAVVEQFVTAAPAADPAPAMVEPDRLSTQEWRDLANQYEMERNTAIAEGQQVLKERDHWKAEAYRMQAIAQDLTDRLNRQASSAAARPRVAAAPRHRPARVSTGPYLTVVGDQLQASGSVYNPSDDWADGVVEIELFVDGRNETVETTEAMRLPPSSHTDYVYMLSPFSGFESASLTARAKWIER